MNGLQVVMIFGVAAIGFVGGRLLRPAHSTSAAGAATESMPPGDSQPSALLHRSSKTVDSYSWTDLVRKTDGGPAIDGSDWQQLFASIQLDPFMAEHVVRRWSNVDPAGCWAHITTLGDGLLPPDYLAKIAIEAWADTEPEAAMAALMSAKSSLRSNFRSSLIWKAFRRALNVDLERGMALVPTERTGGPFSWGSIEPWMEADPERACRRLLELPPGNSFRISVGPAATAWFKKDREAALSWVADLPLKLQSEALQRISSHLGLEGELEAVRDLALTTESMLQRQGVAAPYMRHLRDTDPAAACQWTIENFDGRMRGAVMQNNIGLIDPKNFPPSRFAPYFDEIPAGVGKGEASTALFGKWVKSDGKAAADWFISLDESSLDFANSRGLKAWLQTDDGREWLPTAQQTPFLKSVVKSIAQ